MPQDILDVKKFPRFEYPIPNDALIMVAYTVNLYAPKEKKDVDSSNPRSSPAPTTGASHNIQYVVLISTPEE